MAKDENSLTKKVVRVSGNLQVYKQLLPLGKDILNNNKAPIKFIIKLISEEVTLYESVGLAYC